MCRPRTPDSIASKSRSTTSARRRCPSRFPRCRRCQHRLHHNPHLRRHHKHLGPNAVPPPPLSAHVRLPLLLLAAVLAMAFDLGGYPLFDPDEGRNAEVAREMAETNDFVLPHLNGLPYLDKPIVYFAAAAVTMKVLGPNETAARLPALLFTIATLVVVVRFARRRWGSDTGWLAGLALATMPLVLAYARTTIFDSALAFCTTLAILAFWEDRPLLAWAAIGVGSITKGPIAILIPLATVVPFALLAGRPLRRFFPLAGLGVFLLVALPWFLAVSARIPY